MTGLISVERWPIFQLDAVYDEQRVSHPARVFHKLNPIRTQGRRKDLEVSLSRLSEKTAFVHPLPSFHSGKSSNLRRQHRSMAVAAADEVKIFDASVSRKRSARARRYAPRL